MLYGYKPHRYRAPPPSRSLDQPGARAPLIVSCQALPHEPLFGAEIIARLAVAAQQGGAAAIHANTRRSYAIHAAVNLPIVGLYRIDVPGYAVYITPTVVAACEVAAPAPI